ncbi:restriction endonuclease subunit S [Campylobacter upsaliensis]|nr:restriction endonuclease subunit S [Campylobacter upsaliensis]
MKALNDNAHPLKSLLQQHCPNGVEFKELGEVCELKRGRIISKKYLKDNVGEYPVYSSQTQNNGIFGYINSYDFNGEFVSWTTDGANAGSVFYINGKFSVTNVCGLLSKKTDSISMRFLYFVLSITAKDYVNWSSPNPKLMSNKMAKIKIPLPPLEIQYKIVEILDAFTELEAELEARLKQYHYYRNKLLSHDELENRTAKSRNDSDPTPLVPYVTLGEACEILDNLRKPITKSKRTQGIYPYYGANGIQDYVNEYIFDGDFLLMGEDGSVINKDNSPVLNWVSGKFWVNNHAHILKEKSNTTNLRFVFFYLQTCDVSSIVRGVPPKINQQNLRTIQIPLPPLAVQNDIVELLDKFDTLTNDLTSGIPAEIEARKKQYEYYRERLLSFITKD